MYIQLAQNYRDFDKIRITEIHFYEGDDVTLKKLTFRYQVYKKDGESFIELFNKNIYITEPNEVLSIASIIPQQNDDIWKSVSRALLRYIIDNNIESGTLELE